MPELVDICDQEGHLIGSTMQRSEAHRLEAWHRSVMVWLINSQGQILLQRRAEHLGAFPGLWDVSVVGHISAGDEPTPTAVRELREELGIQARADQLHFADTQTDRYMLEYGKMHQEYDFIFIFHCQARLEDFTLQAAEVLEVRWADAEEFQRDLQLASAAVKYSRRNPRIYQIAIDAARQQALMPGQAV